MIPRGQRSGHEHVARKYPCYGLVGAADDGSFIDANRKIFTPDGQRITCASDPSARGASIISADPRYLVFEKIIPAGPGMNVRYSIDDRAARRTIASCVMSSNRGQDAGMLFVAGARMALVRARGAVVVFEHGAERRRFGNGKTAWRWGEDGSIWEAPTSGTSTPLRYLHWRSGRCRMVGVPAIPACTADYYALTNPAREGLAFFGTGAPAGPAVWGDGRLIASAADTAAPAWRVTVHTWLNDRLPTHLPTATQYRTLSLYRHGARVAVYRIPYHPAGMGIIVPGGGISPIRLRGPRSAAHEHLAFTADGRHLCWLVDIAGTGKLSMYVFRVRP